MRRLFVPIHVWASVAARRPLASAFVLYFALASATFGRLIGDPVHQYFGAQGYHDPSNFMWYFVWWPYAIIHGLNPFVTHVAWVPDGVNLAWATSVPGAALLASPVTLLAGPVIAYNAFALLSLVLGAWCAFVLCRHVTRNFWPSLVGGYVYGFSTSQVAHSRGHLNLTLNFVLPLCVLFVVMRLEQRLRPRPFVALLALALIAQFSFSTEVFFTMTVFAAAAGAIAYSVAAAEMRRSLLQMAPLIVVAYLIALVVLTPYVYFIVTDIPAKPLAPVLISSDLVNFTIPTIITWIGGSALLPVSSHFGGNTSENVAYVGVPLLIIVFAFCFRRWHERITRFLGLTLLLVSVASLGPVVHVTGINAVAVPWRGIWHLRVVDSALPARYMNYAFLLIAMIGALWLASAGTRAWGHWALAVLAVAFLFPNLSRPSWTNRADTPAFFTSREYRSYLKPDDRVLILPFGFEGDSMLWQAETDMRFDMVGGYLIPGAQPSYLSAPVFGTLITGQLTNYSAQDLKRFLCDHGATAVVVAERKPAWTKLLASLRVQPLDVGGVTYYGIRDHWCDDSESAAAVEPASGRDAV